MRKPSREPSYSLSVSDDERTPPQTNVPPTTVSFIYYYIVAILVSPNVIYRKRSERKMKELLQMLGELFAGGNV